MGLHRLIVGCAMAVFGLAHAAYAQTTLKLAVGAPGSWETSIPEIGQRAGIFKKHGIELELLQSQGGGETIQAVISGSVDIGIGTGLPGVLGAFAKGAPLRIIANECTGASEFWYVQTNSKFKTLGDPELKTIAYSTNGSSTHGLAKALAAKFGSKAQLLPTGGPPTTMTQVMSGQIDAGWTSPPLGIREIDEGKIRVIARGSDVPGMDDETIRVITTNAQTFEKRGEDLRKFLEAYQETVEYLYSDPTALEVYAQIGKTTPEIAKRVRDEFVSKKFLDPFRTDGIKSGMQEAVDFKYIPGPLSDAQLQELVRIRKP
jgi:ABC-type nitrate/sulfonate/bicarbonate transport system substrate-binding protein